MYVKLDPVCDISSKLEQDRDKNDEIINYFMRSPSAITFPGRYKTTRIILPILLFKYPNNTIAARPAFKGEALLCSQAAKTEQ